MLDNIDDRDLTLIRLMQSNARTNLDVLSEASHLSVPSVQRRLKKLRNQGVIEKEVAVISPEKLGFHMTFIVMVELERESLDMLNAFKKQIDQEARVQQSYYVTGESDFILICVVQSAVDFEDLTHTLFFNNTNVRRFRTSMVLNKHKVGLEIPYPNSHA